VPAAVAGKRALKRIIVRPYRHRRHKHPKKILPAPRFSGAQNQRKKENNNTSACNKKPSNPNG
jgi:hypothetical protein